MLCKALNRQRISVLFILNSLGVGGAEKQVVSLINRIDRQRFAVSLLYLKDNDTLLFQLVPDSCPNGIQCLGVSKGMEWAAVQRIADHIEQRQVDVVVCTNMYAQLYGWLARLLARRKPRLVEVFHTTDIGSRKERLSMLLYRPLTRRADLLVYVCRAQGKHWHQQGLRGRQDAVIYNGIDTARFEDRWSSEEKSQVRATYQLAPTDYVVALCAVMRPEKAQADLLAAVAALRAEGFAIKCLLIGDGPERSRIEARITQLGLTEHVRITGLLQDVRSTVSACDVMVLTSHAVETFSIAALEAMALGKPMVMTDIGGAQEQVIPGEHGFLYPAGDIAALAERLRALHEPALREALGKRAAARVRADFGISNMVEGYERALTALVAGEPVATNTAPVRARGGA